MKKLRKGFTTGTCAAAAAKAAALLLTGERKERVSVALPSGKRVSLTIAVLEGHKTKPEPVLLRMPATIPM